MNADERIDYAEVLAAASGLTTTQVAELQAFLLGAVLGHLEEPGRELTDARWRRMVFAGLQETDERCDNSEVINDRLWTCIRPAGHLEGDDSSDCDFRPPADARDPVVPAQPLLDFYQWWCAQDFVVGSGEAQRVQRFGDLLHEHLAHG